MLNHIVIMGRLVRDPELRRTQSGTAVTSFRVAVDRDFQNKSGEKQTDYIDCVAWQQRGEFVQKYFQRGSMIIVSGSLQMREWTDKDNNKRVSAEINADNVYFGEAKRDRDNSSSYNRDNGGYNQGGYQNSQSYGNQGYNSQPSGGYQGPARGSDFEEYSDEDGDLPF